MQKFKQGDRTYRQLQVKSHIVQKQPAVCVARWRKRLGKSWFISNSYSFLNVVVRGEGKSGGKLDVI